MIFIFFDTVIVNILKYLDKDTSYNLLNTTKKLELSIRII